MLFGSVLKLLRLPSIIEGMAQHGISPHLVLPVGIIDLICVMVYVVQQTTVLGAILMTGLFGGAILTNVRVSDPTYVVTVILGIMVWAGIYFRDERVRKLIGANRRAFMPTVTWDFAR
jgi:hypothetical protein